MRRFATVGVCLLLWNSVATSAIADDLSTVFIDLNQDRDEQNSNPTLGELESVVAQGSANIAEQIINITNYIRPILEEDATMQFLQQIDDIANEAPEDKAYVQENGEIQLRAASQPDIGIAAFAPILDRLESNDLPQELLGDVPENLKGLALYPLVATLRYALCLDLVQRTIANGSTLNTGEWCEVPRLGKITRFDFNNQTGIGDFDVTDMTIDRYEVIYDIDKSIQFILGEQWSLFYTIAIVSPGFDETLRREQIEYEIARLINPDEEPFKPSIVPGAPEHPPLPAMMKDALDGESIWARRLDRRLFAYGPAVEIIKVTRTRFAMRTLNSRVSKDGTYGDISRRQFVRNNIEEGPEDLGANHPYLQPSEIACIDIMLDGIFPEKFEQFPEQTGYCLGR